jgi:hypothetical protein
MERTALRVSFILIPPLMGCAAPTHKLLNSESQLEEYTNSDAYAVYGAIPST